MKLNNVEPHNRTKVIPLDQDARQHEAMLNDLQGNILKGHGRHYTSQIFLKFGENPTQTKKWIREFSKNITSASHQRKEALLRRKALASGKKWKETPFTSFVLSAKGYQALGFKNDQIPSDPKFRKGMKASGSVLNDPGIKDWEAKYRGDIHAIIILANQVEKFLINETLKLRESINKTNGALVEITTEQGRVNKNKYGDLVEHFGYVDGRS